MANIADDNTERTQVFYGEEDAMKVLLQTMVNVQREADVCADANSAAFFMGVEPVKKAYVEFKKRNVKIRFITPVSSDNLSHIKDLMNYAEVRHLDIVKGNMAVSETEYISTATVERAKPVTQTIYSNARPIVEQQRYFFENLWIKAIPAEERIKELEGLAVRLQTRAIRGGNEILQETLRMVQDSNEYCVYSLPTGLLYAYNYAFDIFRQVLDKCHRGEHAGIRWITNLQDLAHIEVAEKFSRMGMKIRHAKNLPLISFGISDKEMGLTAEKMEGGKLTLNAIFSNEPIFTSHFTAIFDELWDQGQELSDRMNEVMTGKNSLNIDVIHDPYLLQHTYDRLVESARSEAKLVLPTTSAFLREEKIGIIQSLLNAANRGVQVRILTPTDEKIEPRIANMLQKQKNLEVRQIRKPSNMLGTDGGARSKILVVDRRQYLIVELKDDSKDTFVDAVRLGIYSNSESTVLSYTMLFDSLWDQADLYEQLEMHDKMQKEFINIAAHELRTPIQPILGTANLMESEFRSGKDTIEVTLPEVDIIIRNANRLERLSSDILDVARIESNSLKLEKRSFNLSRVISDAISDIKRQQMVAVGNSKKADRSTAVTIEYVPKDITIKADRERITQVIYNLLNNAAKFTKEGTISIRTDLDPVTNEVKVEVEDTGNGIDPSIADRLFTKFATKSDKGTGLGLFISKNIIEAHGGRIWAKNNLTGRGAKFIFILPLSDDSSSAVNQNRNDPTERMHTHRN